ncbi:tetratricopeptide repeat protein [Dyella monticola]|uniref:Tetratricopeptide repeat protein n=2 Tax=Dyella monticola TaxID=1927958 RepID=A0A370X0F7_9GAMM|nr:tetratricopeptide repeat protein [Dyella monticola]
MLAGAAFALMLASTPALASDNSSSDQQKTAPLYPNATRQAPKLDLTDKKEADSLNKGLDAAQANNKDLAQQLLQPLADNSKSKYAQAMALQGLARVHALNNDLPGAIDLLKRSLDNGVMPNDAYFQLQYELAKFYLANQQFQQCIDTIEKWRADGKSDSAESHAVEGEAYYHMQKYPESIDAIKQAQSMTNKPDPRWTQLLIVDYNESGQKDKAAALASQQVSAEPTDATSFHNALSLDIQLQKYDDAIKLMEEGKSKGLLTTENDYVTMTKLYMNKAQDPSTSDPGPDSDKAVQTLEEGMTKGVVKPSADNYVLLGDANMIGGNGDAAAAAYKKAIPLATDGEPAYKAGLALVTQNQFSAAKPLLQQAISKGVKHKGRAYMALAQANVGLKDKAAAAQAVLEAEKDPETAAQAKKWLKDANIGS